MSEDLFLTKARLLQGADYTEDIETDMGVFRIRPLTDGEKAKFEALAVKGVKAEPVGNNNQNLKMSADMEQLLLNQHEAEFYLIACGLSFDNRHDFKPAEIKRIIFKGNSRALLVAKIKEVSGMDSGASEILELFRKEHGRPEIDNNDDPWEDTSSDDGGGVDAASG